jgi:hypothetical protein
MTKRCMEYLSKYKGDRKLQVEDFLKSLNEEWKAITVTDIQNKFFKRSRSFTLSCLKDLEEASIIEKKSGEFTYVNSKWVMNSNMYRLLTVEEHEVKSIIEEDDWFKNWNPKKMSKDTSIEDEDFGEADGIEGIIESIDL